MSSKQIFNAQNLNDLFYFLKSINDSTIVSGCTQIKELPEKAIAVRSIPELNFAIKRETRFDFGPEITLSQILRLDPSKVPQVFYEAVKSIGNSNIRNMATLAGNICAKNYRHTLFAPLLALDSKIELKSEKETAHISITGIDTIPENFVITRIMIPVEEWDVSIFRRLGPSHAITENSASFVFLANSVKNQIANIRIAFAGPFSLRSQELENKLLGAHLPLSTTMIQETVEEAAVIFDEKSEKKGTSAVLKAQFLNLVKSSLEQLT